MKDFFDPGAPRAPEPDHERKDIMTDMTTPQGKPNEQRRAAIAAALRDIVEVFMEFPKNTLDPDTPLVEVGADSLLMIDLIRVIQEDFGVKVTIQEMFEGVSSITALAAYVAEHESVAAASPPPRSRAAALAVIKRLQAEGPALQEGLSRRTGALVDRLNRMFRDRGVAVEAMHFGSLFRLVFAPNVNSELFYYHMLDNGVHIRDIRNCSVSTAHTDADLDAVFAAVEASVRAMQDGGFLPAAPEAVVDATPAQAQLFTLARFHPRAVVAYTENMSLELVGRLSVPTLETTLQTLVDRHEGLRLVAHMDGARVEVLSRVTATIAEVDLTGGPAGGRDEEQALRDWTEAMAKDPMDLHRGPLFRATLLRLGPERALLVIHVHHSIADGISLALLGGELAQVYNGLVHGRPPELPEPCSFRRFAEARAMYLQSEQAVADREFWHDYLGRTLPVVLLPADREPTPFFDFAGDRHVVPVDAELRAALVAVGRRHGATLFMVLFALYTALIHRLTRAREALTAFSVGGRLPGTEQVFGCCTQIVPFISETSFGQSFAAHLGRVKSELLRVLRHQHYPFSELVRAGLLPSDHSGRMPVPLTFNLDRFPDGLALDGVSARVCTVPSLGVKGDMNLNVLDTGERMEVQFEYASDRFSAGQMARVGRAFVTLAQAFAADPSMPMGQAPLCDAGERDYLLRGIQNHDPAPAPRCLHELIADQMHKTPDAPALIDADGGLAGGLTLTYAELDRRANGLAHFLMSRGLVPGDVVALYLSSSAAAFVAILAISKAGGTYLPLRAGDPATRLGFFIRDSRARMVLTASAHAAGLGGDVPVPVVELDRAAMAERDDPPDVQVTPEHAAYIIYTSGSTGRPKGVCTSHRGLAAVAHAMARYFTLGTDDRLYGIAPLSFDASLFEFLLALTAGASLVCPNRPSLPLAGELTAELTRHGITCIVSTPSLWATLLGERLPALRQVLLAGEAPAREHLVPWRPGARIHNLYGLTEATIWSTVHVDAPDTAIGRPITGTAVYVLDDNLEPMPAGVPGQIFLAGSSVAWGYLYRPGLTAARYLPDPFADTPGARMCATGDLGCWTERGTIRCLGRMDGQVKVRGLRIELGEIAAAMTAHPGVAAAHVYVDRERAPTLAAGYAASGTGTTPEELRGFLAERLPGYMVPARLVQLDSMPLTSHGKIDGAAVAAAVTAATRNRDSTGELPRGSVEIELAALWCDLLGCESVRRGDDFFALGGDSLHAARLSDAIGDTRGRPLSVQAIFQHTTLAAMAAQLEHEDAGVDIAYLRDADEAGGSAVPAGVPAVVTSGHGWDRAPRAILLTGATGFLGAHLLVDLGRAYPDADIYCLVRPRAGADARARIELALAAWGLRQSASLARVRVVEGDLAGPGLGLAPAIRAGLERDIDLIVHNGAQVHHLYAYSMLKSSNVDSTAELLRLAEHGRPKRFVYISTLATVMGAGPHAMPEALPRQYGLYESGYVQSKWVSERLVTRAHDRGVAVTVFRPGAITGHSRTGLAPMADDHLVSLIRSCAQLGHSPDISYDVHMLPVDVVSGTIVDALGMPDSVGRVYNLTAAPRWTWRRLMGWVTEHLAPVQLVPIASWKAEHLSRVGPDNPLYPLRALYRGDFLADRFLCEIRWDNTREVWRRTGRSVPELTAEYMARWLGAPGAG